MKTHARLRTALLTALAAVAVGGAFILHRSHSPGDRPPRGERPQPAAPAAPPAHAASTNVVAPASPANSADASAASPLAQGPPVWKDPFEPMLTGSKLERVERRMFQAQTWEPDLARALELPRAEGLERRSGLYRLPGTIYPRVRVDRVYRLGRAPQRSTPAPSAPTPPDPHRLEPGRTAVAATPAPPSPVAPLDAAGGEMVWSNAMVADHLMVQVERGVTAARLAAALPATSRIRQQLTPGGLYLVEVPAEGERSIERAVLALNQLKSVVEYAEPDFLLTTADTLPNDPRFTTNPADLANQWHLPKIMAPRAWDVVKSPKTPSIGDRTVVAIVDTGMDYTHPDLAAHLWTNIGETGGGKETNGLDDDANGRIDDWRGWNFVEGNNNPMDDVGHGTHVAGIVGAIGNNATGATGLCWGVKLLPVRIIKAQGSGTMGTYSAAVAALEYIRDLNKVVRRVAVANHSWGGAAYSLPMLNAVNSPEAATDPLPLGLTGTFSIDTNTLVVSGLATEIAKIKVGMTITAVGIPVQTIVTIVSGSAITVSDLTTGGGTNVPLTFSNPIRARPKGIVHVAAAGNSRFNSDRLPTYPACLPSGFMLSVGATDASDAIALYTGGAGSNFGRLNVDLFAPGKGIVSTKWKAPGEPTYTYEMRDGTSMAAPMVAGAVALVRMWQPNLTEAQTRQVIVEQTDPIPALKSQCVSGGRLNVAKVIDRLYQPILVGSGGGTGGNGIEETNALSGAWGLKGKLALATSADASHALAVVGDKVWSWGSDEWGELGDGAAGRERPVPMEIPGLNEVTMVAASPRFSMALRAEGTVWVWGSNENGLFANGTKDTDPHPTFTQVAGLPEIVWIAASPTDRPYCMAVGANGLVYVWGDNSFGQLGLGDTDERLTPTLIPSIVDILQVRAGVDHAIAVTKTGSVYAWGPRFGVNAWEIYGTGTTYGGYGWNSLGDGPDVPGLPEEKSPVLVPGLAGIVQVEAGLEYSLALSQDGTVWEWGHRPLLTMNQGSHVPVPKPGLTNIVALAGGAYHFFAQNSDGDIFGWGFNAFGALGNGSEVEVVDATPVLTPDNDAILSIAAGAQQSVAVTADGKVLAWGLNHRGQLGSGRSAAKAFPVPIATSTPVLKVGTDGTTQFAITGDHTLLLWGFIGDNTGANPAAQFQRPIPVPGYTGVVDLVLGLGGAFFRKNDGTAFWIQSSDVNLPMRPVPFPESIPANSPPFTDVVAMSTTPTIDFTMLPFDGPHMLLLTSSGGIKSFGFNQLGQLGNGEEAEDLRLYHFDSVPGLTTGVVAVAAGLNHSLALRNTGIVHSWGLNHRGQLGNGVPGNFYFPEHEAIAGLTDVVRIGACHYFSFAIKSDGSVWAWGSSEGAVGFPELATPQLVPVRVLSLPPVREIVASATAMVAILPDGTALVWSPSRPLLLARDPASTVPPASPDAVVGLDRIAALATANSVAFAVRTDGSLLAWGGGDGTAVLGDGDTWKNLPSYVTTFGGSSTIQSTLGTGDTEDSWLFENFSVPELLLDQMVGDTADPDLDGIPNLVEYALDLDPRLNSQEGLPRLRPERIGSTAASTGAQGGLSLFSVPTAELLDGKRYQVLTVNRNGIRRDIDYIVEVSPDLDLWLSGDPHTVTILDTADTLEVYDAAAIDDVPLHFMRLRIERR